MARDNVWLKNFFREHFVEYGLLIFYHTAAESQGYMFGVEHETLNNIPWDTNPRLMYMPEKEYLDRQFRKGFFTENPFQFSSSYCDAIRVAVTYNIQNTELSFEDYPIFLLGFCTDQQLQNFSDEYFSILYQNSGEAKNPFGYIITTNGSSKSLEITNPDGDIAYYSSEPLSMSEFNVTQISIYPNPVKEKLILNSSSKTGNLNFKIFNIEGKILITKSLGFEKETFVDVSQLSKGIYFLNIEDKNGNKTIKKFIKE